MGHLFEGGVYSREAFIANLVTTTVNLLCHLNVNLTNIINPNPSVHCRSFREKAKQQSYEVWPL